MGKISSELDVSRMKAWCAEHGVEKPWQARPTQFLAGTRVMVHTGMFQREAVVLRSGYGRYDDQYRVKYADDIENQIERDEWASMWQCTRIQPD